MPDPINVARRLAAALDRSDFVEAAACLAADCRYELATEEFTGPEAIIASYRASDEWGKRTLDRVEYKSQVEAAGDEIIVTYTDHITHKSETIEYRSRQHLIINDGLVTRIVHEELPGEREKLDEFFARQGIRR